MFKGYNSPDWGMAAYYAAQDAVQAAESRAEFIGQLYAADCRLLAEEEAVSFAFANGEQYYRENGLYGIKTADWHNWLLECAAEESQSMEEAMQEAIKRGDTFTTLDYVVRLANAELGL